MRYATGLKYGYYHIRLSEEAGNLCAIVLPWVKYKYKCLPMGVYSSPDIFQVKMNELFHVFEFIRAYINDLLIINKGDWFDHLEKLKLTIQNNKDNRLKCNIEKLLFRQTDMEYMGFWVTRNGILPVNKNYKPW